MMATSYFTHFKDSIKQFALPEVFDYPFYYEPHPLALQAAMELQNFIQYESNWLHDFGLGKEVKEKAMGKMFGVLVVKNKKGELGYLSAFSGKLEAANGDSIFVPSIYNRFDPQGHFAQEAKKLDQFSEQIGQLESATDYKAAKEKLDQKKKEYETKLAAEKIILQNFRQARKQHRNEFKLELAKDAYDLMHKIHAQKGNNDRFFIKAYAEYIDQQLLQFQSDFDLLNGQVLALKNEQKQTSIQLQNWLLEQYNFLNSKGDAKNVMDLFGGNIPPSGAGDCAAPKLFQHAFQKGYEAIALAEFWWGKVPSSNIRKHKNYYPACRGKCEPILTYMLEGVKVAPNPLLNNPAVGKKLETVYEDEHLVIIHKPTEFLSVPGKFITDSVQKRMHLKYPEVIGPMIVHRLDMSTSGLMILAKSKTVHKILQQAFEQKKITKRYVALLDGVLKNDNGQINLPLRVDLDNRPYQMVCYDYGKPCATKWEVIERNEKTTKVYFYPLSGRTHQLRVHAAHQDGLGAPIIGDDLYGIKKDYLHLHAESISFEHPITKELVEVEAPATF